ncbi:succinate dehydrogenase/fumarate reductase iron-sulfur subunit [Halomonas heilongjiangensis]|uniref:Fumarate reductase iron-sulfur subunit n=1 Tax=Halomonas heilongjiangensis TaxID=1387883 RepID=A0A2N7TJ79_9GAMM|nr:2Fe-2S iron-sulfur cluster-binding protein [Halomonas heilongjiangensis]PMR68246.1 succinate dehydrogenase/fumarate reductase iron-sulfur subunit [Halomonas heilongjiangensis]PXX87489.1 succinate dehydrogenase/fumarate reductase iron-sulfur subunit [Halomonas heilongjiangensis]PXX89482.1 succinate dehydrogenase/fumarate reductase iron-sulfur subunit [Halomonas heilongjiangensis]PXX93213.1 succinate dehydrogenase/fumarate reductase iron-sulfur subunit [Halomonas heilongjiangensis]
MSKLKVSVWRSAGSGAQEYFDVPRKENQTILDVVTYIQRNLDPTLSYRYACRVGMCGSCAMSVNGKARWTCRTHVDKVCDSDALDLRPLENFPVVKDLVCDMQTFFDKQKKAGGAFLGAHTREDSVALIKPDSSGRMAVDEAIECIGCGVCYASCDVVKWKPDYLGPAALNRTWTLVKDERDTRRLDRLRAVSGDAGCHSCHSQMSCTQRCPKLLSPTHSISGLKREVSRAALKGEL